MLEVDDLGCLRGERRLFGNVSFNLKPGGLVWIQGGNGSGKTTLLRTLCGLSSPMVGEVRWHGKTLSASGEDYRRALTYIGHANGLKEDLSALENLSIVAQIGGQPIGHETAIAALRDSGLAGREQLPVKFLSQGQRRRAALARLWLPQPRALWLLDEPYNALDAGAIEALRGVMQTHLTQGGMIVLTSHQEIAIQSADNQTVRLDS